MSVVPMITCLHIFYHPSLCFSLSLTLPPLLSPYLIFLPASLPSCLLLFSYLFLLPCFPLPPLLLPPSSSSPFLLPLLLPLPFLLPLPPSPASFSSPSPFSLPPYSSPLSSTSSSPLPVSTFSPKLIPSYCPSEEQFVEVGVKAALRDVLQKGVLLYVTNWVYSLTFVWYREVWYMLLPRLWCISAFIVTASVFDWNISWITLGTKHCYNLSHFEPARNLKHGCKEQ